MSTERTKTHDDNLESHRPKDGGNFIAAKPIVDEKDNAIQRREEAKLSSRALRLTKGDQAQFSINMGDGKDVQDKRLLIADKGLSPLDKAKLENKKLDEFHTKYGVDVEARNGRYEFHSKVNGKDTVLFSTEASLEGLQKGELQTRRLIDEKEADLSKRYGVTFSLEGDLIEHQKSGMPATEARSPSLSELTAIENALEKSQPTGKNTNFQFVENSVDGAATNYLYDTNDKKDYVIIPRDATNPAPATEGDLFPGSRQSVEAKLIHELGHKLEHKLQPEESAGFTARLGWIKLEKNSASEDIDILIGKDGKFYRNIPGDTTHSSRWYRCDPTNGDPLDAAGNAVSSPDMAEARTNEQMKNLAMIRPSSNYFDSPSEEFAESVKNYRTSAKSREAMRNENPELFAATEEALDAEKRRS